MQLTNKQEQAVKMTVQRYKSKEAYTTISGYAGAGKTTVVKFVVSALNLDPEFDVAYIAYTGKAAQVLRNHGCPNATTAHRLLYQSVPKNDGTFIHIPKSDIGDYKIIIIDEVSLLPKNMWDLLLSHHIHVIALGDPGQLPPISEDNGVLAHPHIFLDEIMRQAQESEIVRLSMDIREERKIEYGRGNEVNVVQLKDMNNGMYRWADQIICGRNTTRREINNICRQMKWGDEYVDSPLAGDRIVCLKNNWNIVSAAGDALVNGASGCIEHISVRPHLKLNKQCNITFAPESLIDCTEDQMFRNLLIDWNLITTGEPTINKENYGKFPKRLRPEQFDYGYCVTCWKAQGSEYDKVLFLGNDYFKKGDRENYKKFLYTGITRAVKRLTFIF